MQSLQLKLTAVCAEEATLKKTPVTNVKIIFLIFFIFKLKLITEQI